MIFQGGFGHPVPPLDPHLPDRSNSRYKLWVLITAPFAVGSWEYQIGIASFIQMVHINTESLCMEQKYVNILQWLLKDHDQ